MLTSKSFHNIVVESPNFQSGFLDKWEDAALCLEALKMSIKDEKKKAEITAVIDMGNYLKEKKS